MPLTNVVTTLPDADIRGERDSIPSNDHLVTTVLPQEHGLRLDAVLARLLPQWGLRARRRLCEQGRVLLNGKPGLAAVKTRAGQRLEWRISTGSGTAFVHECSIEQVEQIEQAKWAHVAVVCQNPDFAVFNKPVGLHSVALAGSAAPSLEGWMREHFVGTGGFVPRTVNRLDRGTSGLVLAVCSEQGLAQWTQSEAAGTIDKRYLALVIGSCTAPMTIRTALRTADRKITRPCTPPIINPDPLRHTHITPLGQLDAASMATLLPYNESHTLPRTLSLLGCRIRKGARHQIRVHLALQGFPLWGDSLYGVSSNVPDAFFLHHGHLAFTNFNATVKPQWLATLSAPLQRVAADWLAAPTVF